MANRLLILLGIQLAACTTLSGGPELFPFAGKIVEPSQLGAVAVVRDGAYLVIAADKGNAAQVLKKSDDGSYAAWGNPIVLMTDPGKPKFDLDIEAAACHGSTVYLAGSHSYRRKRIVPRPGEDARTYAENRVRLANIEHDKERDHLFRFELDGNGKMKPESLASVSLRKLFSETDYFRRFSKLPGRENGVNIEGMAADNEGRIYLGFRSPVFRDNFVPVLVLAKFDPEPAHELRFVDLGGDGIRGMAACADKGGFLLLAGPVGDRSGRARIHHWNGRDCIPGTGNPGGVTRLLHDNVLAPHDKNAEAEAEGLGYLGEDASHYRVLLLFDRAHNGRCLAVDIRKPR